MHMSNPRVINKRGGGETDGAIALFLRDVPTFCVGGVFFGSSFLFALQFPLVRVCFGPTFRLAFCPQWGLIGIDSFLPLHLHGGGFLFLLSLIPLISSSTDCPGLPSLVASRNFNKISSKKGAGNLSLFSGLRVRTPAIFSSINPFYTLTKDPLNLVFFERLSNI